MQLPDAEKKGWQRWPEAEAFILKKLESLSCAMPNLERLREDLLTQTGILLQNLVDHIILSENDDTRKRLRELGFRQENAEAEPGDAVFLHTGAIIPRVLLRKSTDSQPDGAIAASLKVERVADFLKVCHVASPIEGSPLGLYRRAAVWTGSQKQELIAVERGGYRGFVPQEMDQDYQKRYIGAYKRWSERPRQFVDSREGMKRTLSIARSIVDEVGRGAAASLVFTAERAFWQQRNRAARIQLGLQEKLGLGWANHDHHTFRSSRDVFPALIHILETLGFHRRERFYAGSEAGWGAQIMEHHDAEITVFADVDLTPEEVDYDFSRQTLEPRKELGTVGLWCALHGDSIHGAGLHHLAVRFDFDKVTAGLAELGVEMMHPFSNFSYLRQAFTKGERWKVSPDRITSLRQNKSITSAQKKRFSLEGSIGSHVENIQRREGYRGFNQGAVSDIILRTDPRTEFGAA
jgi:hypothetical protein